MIDKSFRILIVDDEPNIAKGIHELINIIEEYDIKSEYCFSYNEAIEKINDNGWDLIVSDIEMPGNNGIALLKYITTYSPDTKFIFLSGYTDYSYMREAVKYQAFDYVLKINGMKAIKQSILTALSNITEDREEEAKKLSTEATWSVFKEEMIQACLVDWFIIGLKPEFDVLSSYFPELNMEKDFIVFLQRFSDESLENNVYKMNILRINHYLHSKIEMPFYYIHMENNSCLWLFQNISDEPVESLMKNLLLHLEVLTKMSKDNPHEELYFSVYPNEVSKNDIPLFYRELYTIDSPDEKVDEELLDIIDVTIVDTIVCHELQPLEQLYTEMDISFANCNKFKFFTALHDIIQILKLECRNGKMSVIGEYMKLCYMLTHHLFSLELNKEDMEGLIDFKSLNFNHITESTFDELLCFAKNLFSLYEKISQNQKIDIFSQVDNYIYRHLDGELSLNHIAEHVAHLNHSYFSRLFKQNKGISFSKYVFLIKINRAAELLKNTDIKIQDIADQLGFDNVSYFSTAFKRHWKFAPAEYRLSFNA